MNSGFFVRRPVLAAVLSIVVTIAGIASIFGLPVERYPDLVPPEVTVSATFPGADAETVAQTVSAVLEQEINGVQDMIYMTSTNTASGSSSITVTFASGTDPDQATIDVNNRVQRARASLPEEVQRQGVTVQKQNSSILAVATLSSTDDRYDRNYLANYALLYVIDTIRRLPGVGQAQLFSRRDYSMRVWLDPDRLARFGLVPGDVADAIRSQNAEYAAGSFGAEPSAGDNAFRYAVTTSGRLPDAGAFEDILLRTDENGTSLRLRDVARVELGAESYALSSTLDGEPAVPIGLYLQPGANALDTIGAITDALEELSEDFPEGVEYAIPYDTTTFISASIEEVLLTFAEAMALVFVVVYLFLQSFRATLIPMLAVPVSIVGTFSLLLAFGFSINLLTLFALVLAIGIVVDDAIVVLENVQRIMRDEGLEAPEATIKAMGEVTGPVIAIVLVLNAVFLPVAFLGGLAGTMYRQFAITIASSVTISGIVALTLTPALCALLLGGTADRQPAKPFRWFNSGFSKLTDGYGRAVAFLMSHVVVGMVGFALVVAAAGWMFATVPGALVPDEDQGTNFGVAVLPPAASLSRTRAVMETIDARFSEHPAVEHVISLSGFDLLAGSAASNAGTSFIQLKDWSERGTDDLDARNLPGTFIGMNSDVLDANVLAFSPPPIPGLSTTGGFEFFLQDRRGEGSDALLEATRALVALASEREELANVRTTFVADVPRYEARVLRDKARALGVPVASIFETMQATLGSVYVNDFTLLGRNYRVSLQSDAEYRQTPEDLRHVHVRSDSGRMIPLDSLVELERTLGPDIVQRFNSFAAANISGEPAPGYSSGQALAAMQSLFSEVADGYEAAWTGTAYQELETGSTAVIAIGFGILMVFLILAAQYERWSLPIAVLGAVPFAVLGALIAISLRGIDNDVYFQIGLVTLVGLAAKNAILIVEFAVLQRDQGKSAFDAALEGAKLRFRPIIMTSLAFILGVVPLATSSGAGAASRHSIGTGVIGGMLAATVVAILFVPMFYLLLAGRDAKRTEGKGDAKEAGATDGPRSRELPDDSFPRLPGPGRA